MYHYFKLIVLFFLLHHSGQVLSQKSKEKPIKFILLQLNDVYEIAPLSNGKIGGMARVATMRKQLLKENPNTITLLAGDFVSPSLIGTLSYYDSAVGQTQRISGKHMVDVMNHTGIDYVTFGNHEFDIPMYLLKQRINESTFKWISANVFRKTSAGDSAFIKQRQGKTETIMPYVIRSIKQDKRTVRVGIIGATLDFTKTDSVSYTDVNASVKKAYDQIKGKCDFVIALTHLEMNMDEDLATAVPGLKLILGGHEHVAMDRQGGKTAIYKADANAKSVYIHRILFYPASKKIHIQSELKHIDENIVPDKKVEQVVQKWIDLANAKMKESGYDPQQKLMTATTPLDGRESMIRNQPTNYTRLIADALIYAMPEVDLAFFNSGSLRVDDQLEGDITQYDVLRSLPYGGALVTINITGKDLEEVFRTGTTVNKNNGGYLQFANAGIENNSFTVKGQPIDTARQYSVLLPAYVAKGLENNLGFLKQYPSTQPPGFHNGSIKNDIRDVVIAYMRSGERK